MAGIPELKDGTFLVLTPLPVWWPQKSNLHGNNGDDGSVWSCCPAAGFIWWSFPLPCKFPRLITHSGNISSREKAKLKVEWYLQSDIFYKSSQCLLSRFKKLGQAVEGECNSYWYLKGSRLEWGGEGSEGWVLDCSHNRAAICFQCGQNKGICLNDLRLNKDLEGGQKVALFFVFFFHLVLVTQTHQKRVRKHFHRTENKQKRKSPIDNSQSWLYCTACIPCWRDSWRV